MKKIGLCLIAVLAGAGFAQAQLPPGTATSEVNSIGTTTYRDKSGNTSGTSEVNSIGTTTYRDQNGRKTGTSKVNSIGTTHHDER